MNNDPGLSIAAYVTERYNQLVEGDPKARAVQIANRLLRLGLDAPEKAKRDQANITPWFGHTQTGDRALAARIERTGDGFVYYSVVVGAGGADTVFHDRAELPEPDQVYLKVGTVCFSEEDLRSADPRVFITNRRGRHVEPDDPEAVELFRIIEERTLTS